MNRTEVINYLIKKNDYKRYLEIGVQWPEHNYDLVECDFKQGVEPNVIHYRENMYEGTSDQFFKESFENTKYCIIFIDGLHEYRQTIKDIENSLKHLAEGGTLVCHDMLPTSELMQKVPREVREWTGDCWRAFDYFRMREDLIMYTIDTDYGLGIIQRGNQKPFVKAGKRNWKFFKENKEEMMNTISVKQFKDEN